MPQQPQFCFVEVLLKFGVVVDESYSEIMLLSVAHSARSLVKTVALTVGVSPVSLIFIAFNHLFVKQLSS